MENLNILTSWAELESLACFEGEISRKIIQAKHGIY